jgi:hypothetical protein
MSTSWVFICLYLLSPLQFGMGSSSLLLIEVRSSRMHESAPKEHYSPRQEPRWERGREQRSRKYHLLRCVYNMTRVARILGGLELPIRGFPRTRSIRRAGLNIACRWCYRGQSKVPFYARHHAASKRTNRALSCVYTKCPLAQVTIFRA